MKPFGKYQLVRRIAAGGMAEVYLATGPNPRSDELIALKLILQHIAEDESFMSMFLQEARLTAPLIHPNLVQVFDLGMTDGRLYLAMEYIRGKALNEVAAAAEAANKPLTPALAAAVVRQACLGLHHAHEARDADGQDLGLIDRDVSPQNMMLDEAGVVKIVDFGVAKATSQSEVSRAGTLKGKVGFMSPEQLKSKPLDRRVDIFALGVVLFELSTGKPLFQGRNDAEILQRMLFEAPPNVKGYGLPAALVKIITIATDRDRAKRYQTAEEMAAAIGEYLGPQLPNTTQQLAGLIRTLFPRSPRTIVEAEAEISASGRKREQGERSLVSRPERTREATPTDPLAKGSRSREPSLPRDPEVTSDGRPSERSSGRPRWKTGPTDPGPPDVDEVATKLNRDVVAPEKLPPPVPSEMEMVTDPHRRMPTGLNRQVELEEPTVSTVTDSVRPQPPKAPPRRRRSPVPAIALGSGAIVLLGALAWWVLGSGSEPAPMIAVHVMQVVDSGPAVAVEPTPSVVIDAGAPASVSLPTPVKSPPKMGAITVIAVAGSTVSIDGRDVGTTPMRELPVPVGKHLVVVTTPAGKRTQTEAVIRERHTTDVRAKGR